MGTTNVNHTTHASNAQEIADHYRPGARPSGGYFAIPCPAHRGDGHNLKVKDAADGGLILRCHSHQCAYNDILTALQADGLDVRRQWTYPNGKVVNRTDQVGQPKDFVSYGTTKGVPLLIRGDSPDALIVLTEGESDADSVLSAALDGVAVGCWTGGAGMAAEADYSAVKGRRVAIWPDQTKRVLKPYCAPS